MSSNNSQGVMAVIQNTKPAAIAELDFVREKYVQNYNHCHKSKDGDLMYHRNLVHFKRAINDSSTLQAADPFSLYACFVTAAVNGYSFDVEDAEVYLVPRGGKAYLQRQAGAHVKRLKRTGQIASVEQAKIVYQGDHFEVENGRVVSHKEKFESEIMVAGYVHIILDESGKDLYFIYRKSDWEAWRKKSPQANGDNWNGNNGQPGQAFLRTKLLLHACREKVWATGNTPIGAEAFPVEIDQEDSDPLPDPSVKNLGQPSMMVTSPDPSYQAKAAAIQMTTNDERQNGSVTVTDVEEGY